MTLESKRCILKPASISEIKFAINNPDKLLKKLDLTSSPNWPTKEFSISAPWAIVGIESKPPQSIQRGSWWLWWIILKPSASNLDKGRIIGHVGFKGAPNIYGALEVTYSLDPTYRKLGLCTEATQALIKWGFKQKNVKKVMADTTVDNIASQRTLKKLGFKQIKPIEQEIELCYELKKAA